MLQGSAVRTLKSSRYCWFANIDKTTAFLLLGTLLQSCSSSPSQQLLQQGIELGLTHQTIDGKSFQLESFSKEGIKTDKTLHVYLEGDGIPWASTNQVSSDPTPRKPIMLRVMALDPSPSLYLGRPCYNGHAEDTGCSPLLWTHRRYAPEVVDAMANGLAGFLRTHPYSYLVFMGHSGGGALALLLAQRFSSSCAAVTVAGNTDIDVWADWHGYSRLEGSLNPAHWPNSEFLEFHYLGGKDKVIPPSIFRSELQKRPKARVIIIPEFNHVCCWEQRWQLILDQLRQFWSVNACFDRQS